MSSNRNLILVVVTNHPQLGENRATGLWLEEFSTPYAIFTREGFNVSVASIKGGKCPIDPSSLAAVEGDQTEMMALLEDTLVLSDCDLTQYAAIYFPGGHGTIYDLPQSSAVANAVLSFSQYNKPIAAVCHGVAALVNVHDSLGEPWVQGRTVTAFTDSEEIEAGLDKVVPFLLQSKLSELGAKFEASANWSDNVVVDNLLITGQNPQSSASTAQALVTVLNKG